MLGRGQVQTYGVSRCRRLGEITDLACASKRGIAVLFCFDHFKGEMDHRSQDV